jgi:hypothetical protein
MLLGTLGPDEAEPPFSQGTLQRFRQRMIAHDLDRRLLERTVELAKKTRGFDYKKLPKDVRLAVDSRSPADGHGKGRGHIQPARPRGAQAARVRGRHRRGWNRARSPNPLTRPL